MRERKTWREKLADAKDLPKLVSKSNDETLIIPAPIEVDHLMKTVPCGKLTTIKELRAALAKKHGAGSACPMTTGIFAWIAAWASYEELADGKKRVTPYWRTLKSGGELNPKYPGGVEEQTARLRTEGHTILRKGKRFVVKEYQRSLVKLA